MTTRITYCLGTACCTALMMIATATHATGDYAKKIAGTPQRTYDHGDFDAPADEPVPAPALQDVTDDARALPGEILARLAPAIDPASAAAADCLESLASALERNGRSADALPLFAAALDIRSGLEATSLFRLALSAQHVLRVASLTTDGWKKQDSALAVFIEMEALRQAPSVRPAAPVVVGVVHGRPVFEHWILGDIEDELRQTPNPRRQQELTQRAIESAVLNEILIAEGFRDLAADFDEFDRSVARSNLTSTFLRYGNMANALQSLRASGTTFDAQALERGEDSITSMLLYRKVIERIRVTPEDIETEYRRRHAEYNPTARGTFGRIILPGTGDAAREHAERIAGRLALGDDFITVAADEGWPRPWATLELDENGLPPNVKAPVKQHFTGLKNEGDIAGPFEVNGKTWWLCLLELDRPEPRSITEVAVRDEIERDLRSKQATERQVEFIQSLLDDDVVRYQLQAIMRELNVLARERFSMVTPTG